MLRSNDLELWLFPFITGFFHYLRMPISNPKSFATRSLPNMIMIVWGVHRHAHIYNQPVIIFSWFVLSFDLLMLCSIRSRFLCILFGPGGFPTELLCTAVPRVFIIAIKIIERHQHPPPGLAIDNGECHPIFVWGQQSFHQFQARRAPLQLAVDVPFYPPSISPSELQFAALCFSGRRHIERTFVENTYMSAFNRRTISCVSRCQSRGYTWCRCHTVVPGCSAQCWGFVVSKSWWWSLSRWSSHCGPDAFVLVPPQANEQTTSVQQMHPIWHWSTHRFVERHTIMNCTSFETKRSWNKRRSDSVEHPQKGDTK